MTRNSSGPLPVAQKTLEVKRTELAGLSAAIDAAQRAVDVAEWMKLQVKVADLPAQVAAAELDVIRLELPAAWTSVEAAVTTEEDTHETLVAAEGALAQLQAGSSIQFSAVAVAERLQVMARANDDASEARATYRAAREITAAALREVDQLEARWSQLTDESIQYGQGLRAEPRPVTGNLVVSGATVGSMAPHMAEVAVVTEGSWDDRIFVPAGTVVPRWLAHLLDPSMFELVTPWTGQPTAAEVEAGRRRRELLEAATGGSW